MNHDMVYDSLQCLDYPVNMNPLIGYSQKYLSERTKKNFQTANKHNKIINIGFNINRIYSWFNNCRWVSIVSSCTKLESATYSCHPYLGETWERELSINHKLWFSNPCIFSTHCRRGQNFYILNLSFLDTITIKI